MQYHPSHLSHIISLSFLLTNVLSQLAHFAVSSLAFAVEVVCCALLLLSDAMVDKLYLCSDKEK